MQHIERSRYLQSVLCTRQLHPCTLGCYVSGTVRAQGPKSVHRIVLAFGLDASTDRKNACLTACLLNCWCMQEAVDLVKTLPGLQAVLLNCCAPQVPTLNICQTLLMYASSNLEMFAHDCQLAHSELVLNSWFPVTVHCV